MYVRAGSIEYLFRDKRMNAVPGQQLINNLTVKISHFVSGTKHY